MHGTGQLVWVLSEQQKKLELRRLAIEIATSPIDEILLDLRERLRPGVCDLLIANGYTQPIYRQGVRVAKRARIATALLRTWET